MRKSSSGAIKFSAKKVYNSTVNDVLTRHCKACGISEISVHGLRHTHASLTEQGEMFITLMSTLAQNEVESLSQNVKMGIRMKQKRGEMMGFNGCLGYDYHPEDKSITVNEEEAETVRLIFELYLQGYGTYTIARQLTEMGRINKKGGTTWTDSGILGIIKNEKYKGDLLMKKTFTVEPYKLTFVMKGNGNTAIPNTKKNFKESAS